MSTAESMFNTSTGSVVVLYENSPVGEPPTPLEGRFISDDAKSGCGPCCSTPVIVGGCLFIAGLGYVAANYGEAFLKQLGLY